MTFDFTRRTMLGALPAFALAGGASAQPTGTRVASPAETDITSTLDAWVDTYGRPTAKVMLNGKGPFSFMVDTGSTTTVLANRHLATLDAPILGKVIVAGTTGVSETPVARIDLIEAGAVKKEDLRVAVLPDEDMSRIDGILGADVFAGKQLVFDILAKSVKIESSRRTTIAATRSNMRVRNGLLAEIDGKVGSVNAKLMLDTGAQNCIANPMLSEALQRAHPRLERRDDVRVFGVTGHVLTGQYIALPKVELRAFSVKDATAIAVDAPIFNLWGLNSEPAMIVGVNLLSRLRSFSIDYAAKAFDAKFLSDLMARNSVAFG